MRFFVFSMNETCDVSDKQLKELLLENGKVLLGVIDNQQRIGKIEKYLFKYKLRYKILDLFLILNTIDIMMKLVFGIGVVGCVLNIYGYIISLF